MAAKYNKLNKEQLVQLLLEKDAQLKELTTRLDRIESRLDAHDEQDAQVPKTPKTSRQITWSA